MYSLHFVNDEIHFKNNDGFFYHKDWVRKKLEKKEINILDLTEKGKLYASVNFSKRKYYKKIQLKLFKDEQGNDNKI